MNDSSLRTVQLNGWLERIQAGDLSARDELLRAASDRLERLARKMLGGFPAVRRWADTADVLQNATLRLLNALQEVRPSCVRDFFGLAAEQMRRELLDLAARFATARRGGGNAPVPLTGEEQASAVEARAEDDPGELELWQRFHEAVAELPAEEREVVGLLFYHDWSQPEAAELFGVDERTIRRRWRSACLRLQEKLHGRFPGGAAGD